MRKTITSYETALKVIEKRFGTARHILSTSEFADLIGVSTEIVRNYCQRGDIITRRRSPRGRYRIPYTQLVDFKG